MPDEVEKTFVRSFLGYLKKQVESRALSPDAQESVEVAIQCLQAAFGVGDDDFASQSESTSQSDGAGCSTSAAASVTDKVDANEIDLFELFQSLYIERNPQTLKMAEGIKNEGNRLMKEGKYNEALLQYNRAITFDPKNPVFYCNRAAAYIRLGDNDRAITDCKSALVYNPNYGKAYGRLGIAYSNLGKYEEAQEAYTKAIELEPDNLDYRNNLEVARNARTEIPLNAIPQLTEGLNTMLSNPAIRSIFRSAEIDLEQLRTLSQNPVIMNAIAQMFSGAQGGGGSGGGGGGIGGGGIGGGIGGIGGGGIGGGDIGGTGIGGGSGLGGPNAPDVPQQMPNDVLQLFRTLDSLISPVSRRNLGTSNNQSNSQQPPPSS